MATTTYRIKKMPEDINKILNGEKAKILKTRGIIKSKESIMYDLIREWKTLKKDKSSTED